MATDELTKAATALVRWHLDNVEVHPCDVNNDDVRARQCTEEVRDLYAALAAPPVEQQAAISNEEVRTNYLDLLQDVLDAKEAMLARGCAQAPFAEMFAEFAAQAKKGGA